MQWHKYQGAGNDFLIADNRDGTIRLDAGQVAALCDRRYGVGADGVMLLEEGGDDCDFRMVYYNSDGSTGMMCGNGGRCIVAFAADRGITGFRFMAADGMHTAEILSHRGRTRTVRLGMRDVTEMRRHDTPRGTFLDTGTRHFVMPVTGIGGCDVRGEGRRVRHLPQFGPVGVNVNFIEADGDVLRVRTYEKGVEDETYACGTGITAAAISWWHDTHPAAGYPHAPVHVPVRALRDDLAVDFTPTPEGAADVFLTGPATYVALVTVEM